MNSSGERLVDGVLGVFSVLIGLILYAPVIVCALFSVVAMDRFGIHWETATFAHYGSLFQNQSIVAAVETTAIVGLLAVATATILSIVLALYVEWEGAMLRRVVELVVYLPFLLPPVVTGLSLLVGFALAGINRGIATLVLGHTVFVLAVLFRIVRTRLASLSASLVEASADLGASRWQTFRYILWPQLRSAVLTGAILAFTMSFDETLISVFLAGDATTLPLRLWAMMRVGFSSDINALVVVVLLVSIVLALVVGFRMKPAVMENEG